MNLLLDTHVLLWWLLGDIRLRQLARDIISNGDNRVCVSVVSGWEMAIKVGQGKLPIPPSLITWLPTQLQSNEFEVLPVTMHEALSVEGLPRHHGDPFDRLLIAQAISQGLTIITADPVFARYGVPLIRN